MSQSRARKTLNGGDANKHRPAVVKAAGDNAPNPQSKETWRSKSRNKLPRSIRYDLENALVGLCDVWFDEIKPHLVRNNIKLHVEGSKETTSRACGDHSPPAPALPRSLAQDCSHLDPGAASDLPARVDANCAGSCTTRRTVSRVPWRRPLPPAPAPRPPPGPRPLPPAPCSPLTLRHLLCQSNVDGERKPRNLCHQHPKISAFTAPLIRRVPRYCSNCKIKSRAPTARKSSTMFRRPCPKKVKTANKFTQTDLPSKQNFSIPPGVSKHGPETKYSKGITDMTSPVSLENKIRMRKHRPDVPLKRPYSSQPRPGIQKVNLDRRTGPLSPVDNIPKSSVYHAPFTAQERTTSRYEPITNLSPRKLANPRCRMKSNTRPNSPCSAATAFYPPRIVAKQTRLSPKGNQNGREADTDSLFDKGLINIIGEKND